MSSTITGRAKADLLKEIRDRLDWCTRMEATSRREAQDDHNFVGGMHWADDAKRMREIEKRPALTINKLPTFVHQVLNDFRQNRPSIKVHPVDGTADIETAEVLQGMIKYIEYNSNSDAALDTAIQHACIGGFGYFRLVTDYCAEDSFDQELAFRRVQNPFTVYLGPHVDVDASDMTYCIITESISRDEFKRQWPKAEAGDQNSMPRGVGDQAVTWLDKDVVRIAEYYRLKHTTELLHRLSDGSDSWESELGTLPDGVTVTGKSRKSERRTVEWFKVTGVDILDDTEILCKWIPVFPIYGDENIINGKISHTGMIRWAKDPMRMYNFWMSSATEEVALRPKTPFIGAVGQFDTAKKEWQQANNRSFAYLEYDPVTVDGQIAPPPRRQEMADVPTGTLAMAMHANDNIKAVMGLFDASIGQRSNETSGRAILARQKEGDNANFHFSDNGNRAYRHAGRCIVYMIPRYYDTQRMVRILGVDDAMSSAAVNQPMDQPEQNEEGKILTVKNSLSAGQYDVTIGTGPSYSTARQEALEAMMQAGQAFPRLWEVAGDKIIRAMDWKDAAEIAERVERTIPPEIRGEEAGQPQGLPPQVQQVLQQAQTELQQLHQQLQDAQSGMAAKQLDAEVKIKLAQITTSSSERIAAANNDSRHDVAELVGAIQLMLKQIVPPPVLAADVVHDIQADDPPPTDTAPPQQPPRKPPDDGSFFMPDAPAPDESQQPLGGYAP